MSSAIRSRVTFTSNICFKEDVAQVKAIQMEAIQNAICVENELRAVYG